MEATLLLLLAPLAAGCPSRRRHARAVTAPARRPAPKRWSTSVRAYAAPAAPGILGHNNGVYTVGDFMTKKENLHVLRPTTSVDQALEMLVHHRISGFPVIDDSWNLVGVVSDYDLLALDSMAGCGLADTNTSMFPEVDSTWKFGTLLDSFLTTAPQTFREIQRLLSKTHGKVIGDVMTHAPLVVRETTNLDAAARLLLETKYHRLPVVDSVGKLVGMITRGNVVRAALKIKKKAGESA